jgi:GTP-binding protein
VKAELSHNAELPEEFPRDGLPEVAVMGRSNVGKSSFINALLGRRGLARTSGRPGKTRRIHFYRVEDVAYVVDLPGFGYAAVGRQERRRWKTMVESYLRGVREPLRGAVLLVDIRRGPEEEELQLLDWLRSQQIPVGLALTKSDKLSPSRVVPRLRELAQAVDLPPEHVVAVSARTKRGVGAIARWVLDWTGVELRSPDGRPLPDESSAARSADR